MQVTVLAQKAYESYGDFRGWKSHDDKPMPQWEELPTAIRNAWEVAVTGVFIEIRKELNLEPRDIAAINAAKSYKEMHSNAGFPGHNLIILLAKFSHALRL